VSAFLCVYVVLCVGRSLGAGLIPRPRSPTKCLKGSISKKENPTPGKGIRNNEEEEDLSFVLPTSKVKVKLSLCLTKHHAMKTYWESGGIAPCILDFGTRWR
jgi:hypothetical protein